MIVRTRAPGWAVNEKLSSAQANQLDANHARACDKTGAGDTITGQILQSFATTATFSGGGDLIIDGAGSQFQTSGGHIVLGDNDNPQFSANRTLVRVAPFVVQQGQTFSGWTVNRNSSKAFTGLGLTGNADISRFLIDGAALRSIDVYFAVTTPHANVPASFPQFALIVRAIATGGITTLAPTSATAGSGPAWYNGGATQTLNLDLGTFGVTIDRTANTYYLQVIDEHGANAQDGNTYQSARLNFISIADMRPA